MKSSVYRKRFVIISLLSALIFNINAYAANKDCSKVTGKVARAIVTTAIENREPINRVLIAENKLDKLYFFSDLRHMQGQQVIHRWEYEGKVVLRKRFDVKGPRWRIYSSNKMSPAMTGRWTVMITDMHDCPIKAVVFQFVKQNPEGQGSAVIDLRNE